MPSSSPSQAKGARTKDSKSNGTNGRATPAEVKTAAPVTSARPTEEDIARRAYEIYERDGRQPGRELENWLAAEAELSGKKGH